MAVADETVRYGGREWALIPDPTLAALDAEAEREEAILTWDPQDVGWVTDDPAIWDNT